MNLALKDVLLSCLRWGIGLSIGSLIGFFCAIAGSVRYSNAIFRVFIHFLRAIPIIGLVPLIQMNIGVNELGKIGLICWAVIFPVWITVRGTIETNLLNARLVLKAAKVERWRYFRTYTFPVYFGGYLKGIELAIGIAWLSVVAAEWVGTYSEGFWSGGLGYKLLLGNEVLNDRALVTICLLSFGALGLTSSYSFQLIVNLFFKKNKTFNPIVKTL